MLLINLFEARRSFDVVPQENPGKSTNNEIVQAIEENPDLIKDIANPTLAMMTAAVESDPDMLQWIKNPPLSVQKAAIRNSWGEAIRFIENPSEALELLAVKTYPSNIKYIKNPSVKLQLYAVKSDSIHNNILDDIQNPCEEAIIYAVRRGYPLKKIKNPTEAITLAAVQYDPNLIKYIEDPSDEIALASFKQIRTAFSYINNPSDHIIELALRSGDSQAITYRPIGAKPNPKLERLSVELYPSSIGLIRDPSPELQKLAVNKNFESIYNISSPTEEIQLLGIKKDPWYFSRLVTNGSIYNIPEEVVKAAKDSFNRKKRSIIRGLLADLKSSDKSEYNLVLKNINTIRLTGIEWPELTVIENSIKHELKPKPRKKRLPR